MILAFKVRSREDLATARAALAEDVGDAVDLGIEPCLSHAPREPLSCSDVLGGERRAMHARLVSAEGCKGPQVRQHALRLDGCHSLARVSQTMLRWRGRALPRRLSHWRVLDRRSSLGGRCRRASARHRVGSPGDILPDRQAGGQPVCWAGWSDCESGTVTRGACAGVPGPPAQGKNAARTCSARGIVRDVNEAARDVFPVETCRLSVGRWRRRPRTNFSLVLAHLRPGSDAARGRKLPGQPQRVHFFAWYTGPRRIAAPGRPPGELGVLRVDADQNWI